jgi:hypothetical protein
MKEKDIEQYLVKQAKAADGKAYKWTSPGNAGVPDRIVILPGGRVTFVELKALGGKSTALQLNQQRFIAGMGLPVAVVDSKEAVDQILSKMQAKGGIPPWH